MEDRRFPMVTFALFAYNQERYIHEAVEAALAQNYPNLEVLISDDASGDNTWEVIQRSVSGYRGPHQLLVNRNSENMGICMHVNAVFKRAHGSLVVLAAGDDLSRSDRVSQLVATWKQNGFPQCVLHSKAELFSRERAMKSRVISGRAADPKLATLPSFVDGGFNSIILGCTTACTTGLMRQFGNLTGGIEDVPLTFRALLSGRLLYVDQPLVRYHVGEENVSRSINVLDPERTRNWLRLLREMLDCMYRDYSAFLASSLSGRSELIEAGFHKVRRSYDAASGLASWNPLAWVVAFRGFPSGKRLLPKLNFYARYFGIDCSLFASLYLKLRAMLGRS